eukprot:77446-Pelagomonas_calceolata.AAC.1
MVMGFEFQASLLATHLIGTWRCTAIPAIVSASHPPWRSNPVPPWLYCLPQSSPSSAQSDWGGSLLRAGTATEGDRGQPAVERGRCYWGSMRGQTPGSWHCGTGQG